MSTSESVQTVIICECDLFEFLKKSGLLTKKSVVSVIVVTKILRLLAAKYGKPIKEDAKNLRNLKCKINCILRAYLSKRGSKCREKVQREISKKSWHWHATMISPDAEDVTKMMAELKLFRTENSILRKKVISLKRDSRGQKDTINRISTTNKFLRAKMVKRALQTVRGKAPDQCTKRHLLRLKDLRQKKMLHHMNESLAGSGYTLVSIVLHDGQKTETHDYQLFTPSTDTPTSTTLENLKDHVVKVMDKNGISQHAYHELTMIDRSLPRSWVIKRHIQEMNETFRPSISDVIYNEKKVGIQMKLSEVLTSHIISAIDNCRLPDTVIQSKCIRVKISGDGTNCGKRKKLLAVTATIVDDTNSAAFHGNNIILLLYGTETYDFLKHTLQELKQQMEDLNHVIIKGETYQLDYFLGGDYKWLLLILGLDSASCKYSCIYCKVSSDERGDFRKEWSMVDEKKGARTLSELQACAAIKTTSKSKAKKFSSSHPPIFDVELSKVVIDNLHLFLRLSDRLMHWLIQKVLAKDNISNSCKSFASSDYPTVRALEELLAKNRVDFHFFLTRDSTQLKFTSLQGPDYVIISSIDFESLLTWINPVETGCYERMWRSLGRLYVLLKIPIRDTTAQHRSEIKSIISEWTGMYVKLFQAKDITPYVHCLKYHVSELVETYGNISGFTQQGLEKLNDQLTKSYFRGTNFRLDDALEQVILRHCRMKQLDSLTRPCGKVHHCSKCGETTHRRPACHEE